MKKEYIFENDWDRGSVLVETGGYYDYTNINKCVYEISDKATTQELRKVERLGDGIKAQIYVCYINFKYRKS
jgi:hypothetical protein